MKTFTIMRRIIKQIINDKRSLALILVVPIFLFTLIYFLMGDTGYKATIAQNGLPAQIVDQLEAQDVTVRNVSLSEGRQFVKDKKADAFLYQDGNGMNLLFESNDAVKTGVVTKAVQNALKSAVQGGTLNTSYIYGKSGDSLFNSLGYILLGIIAFFIVFIIAGISFVRERTTQTMERLMTTPVKREEVVLGYTLGFGFFAVLQSILLLCYVTLVLKMPIAGSAVSAGLIMILLALSAVCIGAFFSIFSNNEFQIMQFIPVVVIPQIFFSGLISLDTLPYHLGILSKIMPIFYASDALKIIMIQGEGWGVFWPDVAALGFFVLGFFVLNTLALKKYRRI